MSNKNLQQDMDLHNSEISILALSKLKKQQYYNLKIKNLIFNAIFGY